MKPDYGIDAPNVVRNLFVFSLLLALLTFLSFHIPQPTWSWVVFLFTFPASLLLFVTGCWMLYGIKVAKPRIISEMIRNLKLKGDETVLDLGCGRGLLLCKIAEQLDQGKAIGIDLWSNKDQSRNALAHTLENAEREGVKERVTIQTGDVRSLPFASGTFDVVVSSLCLHNITGQSQRQQALMEMLRVLKPGGQFALADIQCGNEYAAFMASQGVLIKLSQPNYAYCPPITVVEGQKQ